MPQQGNIKQVNTFVGGLITEASPLNFPPNASIDEANFVLDRDGTRRRRLGVDHEDYDGYRALDISNSYQGKFKAYRWDSVGGNATLSLQVIQMSACVVFFDNTQEYLGNEAWGCIELPVTGNKKMDFTTVNGDLVVATGETNPYVISYNDPNIDPSKPLFAHEMVSLKIRDLFGVEDGYDLTERPTVLTDNHTYNLRNQGFPNEFYCGSNYGNQDPITFYFNQEGRFPSNADQFQYGIVPVQDPSNDQSDEKFKPASLKDADTGSTHAPKGHFIIDAFSRGTSRINQSDFEYAAGDSREVIYNDVEVTCVYDYDGGFWVCDSCEYTSPNREYLLNNNYDKVFDVEVEAYNVGGGRMSSDPAFNLYEKSPGVWAIKLIGDPPQDCPTLTNNQLMGKIKILYKENFSTSSTIQDIPLDRETGRPIAVAAMGERVFYSGIKSNLLDGDRESVRYTGMVFFSKVVNTINDLHKCYQEADPTSRKVSDLVDTDGGHINISECDNIIKLVPFHSALLVFAENGIWEIKGSTDTGFSATGYIVNKVSDTGCVNRDSIVVVDNTVMYWTESSINVITRNNVSATVTQSVSDNKVNSLISNIDNSIIVGQYDRINKTVRWMYDSYSKELVYDLSLQAFYRNTFEKHWLKGYCDVPEYRAVSDDDWILVGNDPVYVGDDPVSVRIEDVSNTASGLKYITINPDNDIKYLTFSQFKDATFKDWQTYDYRSYLITGWDTSGDMVSKKSTPYLMFYFDRTEDGFMIDQNGALVNTHQSSAWVQTRWDWSDSPNGGKWGANFQAYRLLRKYIPSGVDDPFNYSESVIVTKNRVLGRGRALNFKIEAEEGKDLQLLGWAAVTTGTLVP